MAKKKTTATAPLGSGEFETMREDLLKKLGAKVAFGESIDDSKLTSISTGSFKLDWALGTPFVQGSINEIYGAEQTGKAQPLDAKVLTPDGYIEMRDIKPGMYVCTPFGGNAVVRSIHPQGVMDVYRVIFDDNSSVECTLNHLWLTRTSKDRLASQPGTVKTLKEIRDTLKIKAGEANNHSIASSNVFFASKSKLHIKPYLLGLLIGDGYLPKNGCIKLSSEDEEIVAFASQAHEKTELKKVCDYNCDYRFTGKDSTLKKELSALGLLGKRSFDKFIPEPYLITSHENRIALLQGLIDTDGYVEQNGSIEFSTTSVQLLKDTMFLVRSLGGKCSYKSRMGRYRKNDQVIETRENYRLRIRFANGIKPARLTRKRDRLNDEYLHCDRFIKEVVSVGRKECQCIFIDDPNHLYITDNVTPTHNTTLALEAAANAIKQGRPVFFFDLERKLRETSLNMIKGLSGDARKLFTRIRPDTGEEAVDLVHDCIMDFPGCFIVFDSVSAMMPEVEGAESASKQMMGKVAKLCWTMLRKNLGPTERNRCVILFISHISPKLNPYQTGDNKKGGKAISNLASQVIKLKRNAADIIKDTKGNSYGQNTQCEVIKNNMARPFRKVTVPIIWGKGIDKALDLAQLARDLCVVEYSKGWYITDYGSESGEMKRMREAQFLDVLRTDKEYRQTILKAVRELLE